MEVEIHSSVRDLFQVHANPANIARAALLIDQSVDFRLLMCYAMHYRHKEYVRKQYCNSFSRYIPLMTAVYDKAYDMMELFMKTFQKDHDIYHEGFGKIQDDKLLTGKPKTIWDAIFELDDTKSLRILFERCVFEVETLVRLAKLYGAHSCLDVISRSSSEQSSLDSNKLTLKRHSLPTQILYRTCSAQGEITSLIREDTFRMWSSCKTLSRNRKFLTPSDEETLTQLLAGDTEELVRYCDQEPIRSMQFLPDQGSSTSVPCWDLHAKVILECLHIILKSLSEKDSTGSSLVRLTSRMLGSIRHSTEKYAKPIACYVNCMFLLNTMTKMLMGSGVTSSRVQFKTSWLKLVRVDPCSNTLPVYNQFCQHLMILIAYGYKHIHFDLTNQQGSKQYLEFPEGSRYVRGVASVIVSMLPHDRYVAYRQSVVKRRHELEQEKKKESPNEEEIKQRREALKNAHDVSTARSLQQLCRLTLYEIIPDHKRPLLVSQLEIREPLKHMLNLHLFT